MYASSLLYSSLYFTHSGGGFETIFKENGKGCRLGWRAIISSFIMDAKQSGSDPNQQPSEQSVWDYLLSPLRSLRMNRSQRPTEEDHDRQNDVAIEEVHSETEEIVEEQLSEDETLADKPLVPDVSYQLLPANPEDFESGQAKVQITALLPPGTQVMIQITSGSGDAPPTVWMTPSIPVKVEGNLAPVEISPLSAVLPRQRKPSRGRTSLKRTGAYVGGAAASVAGYWRGNLAATLFALALFIYLLTRLVGLLNYPIYFFSDEAMQPLFAQWLIRDGFMDTRNDIFLPVYVEVDGNRWAPLLTIYFHAITMTLFGKTAFVTRATSAVFTLLAAFSISLTLKQIFKARFWWMGALLLGVTPAWFLHSRTAFETVTAASFYAAFLWLYLLYRTGKPKAIFAAAVCAAGAFYSYSNAQAIIALTLIFFLLSDLRYHWQQRRLLLWMIPLGMFLLLPFIIFEWKHPQSIALHLRVVDSYWFHDIPLLEKLKLFLQKYAYGLSPQYWFFSNTQDLERHRMGPYPQILKVMLPFFVIGLLVSLRRIRSAPYRTVLLAGLAVPIGAAQLDIGVPRVISFVIPANILIALGWEWLWNWMKGRWFRKAPRAEVVAQWLLFALLLFGNLFLLCQALSEGRTWFRNYGLYGMQYGATQLFEDVIPELLSQNPETKVILSPTWANGTDRFADFFLSQEDRPWVQMGNIDKYIQRKQEINPNEVFIMSPEEFAAALDNPKFNPPIVERIVHYPDGSPGFYVARLSYSPEADNIFEAEQAERRKLIEDQVLIDDQLVTIRHSWIDMGPPQNMFDEDRYTLMRGMEANPLIVELDFPEPISTSGIGVDFGAQDTTITATLTIEGQEEPIVFSQTYLNVGDPQELVLPFDGGPYPVKAMHLEFEAIQAGEIANIHVREIRFLP